jgi:SAM-dependent methyltransferase
MRIGRDQDRPRGIVPGSVMPRRLPAALTDFAYLLVAAEPVLQRLSRWWARRRYRVLASSYAQIIARDPTYLTPLLRALNSIPGTPAVVIDVGAGTGAATRLLQARFPHAVILACDQSVEMLTRLTVSPDGRPARVVGDAYHLPIVDTAADLVIVSNAPFGLRELTRVLRPGGRAVVALSSAQGVRGMIRKWCVRRAQPLGVTCEQELTAGGGIAWVFRGEVPATTSPA